MGRRSLIALVSVAFASALWSAQASAQTTYRDEVMKDRPLAYYRLDERSGSIAHDSSGHGFDGTIGGHVGLGKPGLIADAPTSMEFYGANKSAASEDIRVKGNPLFARAKDLTIEAWVYPYDVGVYGQNSGDITIAAYGQDDAPDHMHCRYALELDAHSHVWHFPAVIYGKLRDHEVTGVRSFVSMVVDDVGPPRRDFYELYAAPGTDGNPPRAHELYYLVGTYDGETMRFYINGRLNNVIHVEGRIDGYQPTNGMGIGGEYVDMNPVFHGRLSEVAVYGQALTPDRIRAHYLAGVGTVAKVRQRPVQPRPRGKS